MKTKQTKVTKKSVSDCPEMLEASLDYIERLQLTIADLEAELENCEELIGKLRRIKWYIEISQAGLVTTERVTKPS